MITWRLETIESIQVSQKYIRFKDWKVYQSVWGKWKTAIKWNKYKKEAEIASLRRKKELALEKKATTYHKSTIISKVFLAWHVFIENESNV